jgi:L-asparaginase II
MLAGARAIGAALADYHLAAHPLQQRVKRTVAQACDLPDDGVQWAIDGCNLPTPAFALDRLARLYMKLARAADAQASGAREDEALARIYRAMTSHPAMVAGAGRFCTALMRAYKGALVGKFGADASYAIGVRASAQTAKLGAKGALGIAIKVEDGNSTILYAIVVQLLMQLGIGDEAQHRALDPFRLRSMRNTVGLETGRVEVALPLSKVP